MCGVHTWGVIKILTKAPIIQYKKKNARIPEKFRTKAHKI